MGDEPGFPGRVADKVAIIGMGVRFPGAADTAQLWRNLEQGVQSFTRLTDEQLRSGGVCEEDIADPDYIRLRPLLDEMEYFDAKFFGYSARQAQITDPQQRLFLEVCSTALQDAGYTPDKGGHDIGVYGGSGPAEYHFRNVYRNRRILETVGTLGVDISTHQDYMALRVSYALGLTGPALSIATACSSSLVATHLAAQALLNRECGMAIAGGSQVILPYHRGRPWTENGMFSRDGRIRAFDADAQGTNFGTGAGAVVLKRHADALADGDHIYAVLLASAVNNDGARKTSFSAPSEDGQRRVISQALAASGIAPDTIDYVEAHGTATKIGDPIEVAALSAAYREAGAVGGQACPIGSIKTNIGHLGSAAGIAGLIKTVLAMRHGLVPASLNFTTPNPEIDFAETPFYVNAELSPWRSGDTPRRAAVSSFGIGGTNAHVILEEAPPAGPSDPGRTWQILPLSAKTESALATMRTELAAHLRAHPELELADVAHTLQVGRAQMERRDAVVCRDTDDAISRLDDAMPVPPDTRGAATVAFMFPGQGAQHVGMAEEAYRTEPVFRETVDECAELLAPHLGCDVRDVMFSGRGQDLDDTAKAERLRRTELAQPALFTIEYALARLWMSWGIEPTTMVGHSVGEYVAACLAGVVTLPDALELVATRGRLTQSMPAGSMVAVPMGADDLLPMLPDELDLAAVNGPRACVVAGPADAVAELAEWLDSRGVRCRPLHTSHAFHSSMLDPVVEPLREAVAKVALKPPTIPFVSALTGKQITDSEAVDPGYWANHLRGTVRFDAACQELAATGAVLLEVGPGQNLTSLARQSLPKAAKVVASFGRPARTGSDARSLAEAAGRLWSLGASLDWAAVRAGASHKRISLPVYPYERHRYWVDPDPDHDDSPAPEPAEGPTYLPVWRRRALPASRASSRPSAGSPETWLIFTPADGPVDAVAGELAARGAIVIRVSAGARFARLDDDHFEIAPGHRPDYDELLKALAAGPGRPTSILHGWTSGRSRWAGQDDFAAVDAIRDTGFYSVLFLSQAWLARWPDRPVELRVLTSDACNVSGAEQIDPAKSVLRGPCRVIPHESPTITCQLIDTSAADLAGIEPLLTELGTPVADKTVALRAGRRWVEEYEQTDLPDHSDVPRLLRRQGVYLITGGMGGIGLETAKALARSVAARLILVGRTPLPPRQDWDTYLAEHADDDRTSARIRGIRGVESLGGEVITAVADVADEAAMQMVVDTARERFGPVNGVFHAAGVAGGGMALVRTREQAEQVLAPKIEGTLVLDRLLGQEIDVLVLYSSIVAITGDYGMVDYCSANAFLDAYAQARPPGRCATISVNWCGWADVGMTVDNLADAPEGFRALEAGREHPQPRHPLLGRRLPGDEIAFSSRIDPTCHWVLSDHQMDGHAVYPGVAYVELIRAAYNAAVQPGPVELRDLIFTRPLAVDGPRELRVVGKPSGPARVDFTVISRPAGDLDHPWERHASGTAHAVTDAQAAPRRDLAALRARCDAASYQPALNGPKFPVTFGPHWHVVDQVHTGRGEHLVELAIPSGLDGDLDEFVLHPALLDGATALSLDLPDLTRDGQGFLPLAYGRVVVRAPLPARAYSHGIARGINAAGRDIASFDFSIMDENGCELIAIENYSVRGIETAAVHSALGDRPTGTVIELPTTARPAAAPERLLDPAHGIELTWRILNGGQEAQYVISTESLAARADRMAELAATIATAKGGQLAGTARARQDTPVVDTEAVTETERGLRQLWMDAFGIDQLGLDEDFIEIGGNSLVAVQLAVRIRDMFNVALSAIVVLEYPTVRTLARLVDQSISEQRHAALDR